MIINENSYSKTIFPCRETEEWTKINFSGKINMVEIELTASVKTKNYLKTHLEKIKTIMGPAYSITEYRIDDIRQRLFIYIDVIYTETKKRWFSKKTYLVKRSKRICWMCYQPDYGIYIYPSLIEESKKLAELLERNGYKVIIFVDDENDLVNK